jgi:hypothetical protein
MHQYKLIIAFVADVLFCRSSTTFKYNLIIKTVPERKIRGHQLLQSTREFYYIEYIYLKEEILTRVL